MLENPEVFEYDPGDKADKRQSQMLFPKQRGQDPECFDYASLEKVRETREIFADKLYVSKNVGEFMRICPRLEYQIAPGHKAKLKNFETPEQRLIRLQGETSDFIEFLAAREESREEGENHKEMKQELEVLERQLHEILPDEKVKKSLKEAETGMSTQNITFNSLLTQMKQLSKPSGSKDATSDITYELYCKPATQQSVEYTQIASIENKIAALENQLGNTTLMPYENIASALNEVQHRLATFDRAKIEAINKRITVLMQDIDNVLKKKTELDGGNDDEKINELYEMCHQWQASSTVLPGVLARMRALKVIHEQSGSFASRLTVLEQQQSETQKMLETCTTALQQVQKSMSSNIATMQQNMETLQARIAGAK
eukprot:GEMP01032892.1.p1 GENE.GEMP01032892.1~~GEMP01032892.1.p1  ORF type:complete len:372 (+),score=72.35 GEMP01032892.1:61-1176(+)